MIRHRDNPKQITTQTAHGWLAGQLAMYWGNDQFSRPSHFQAVVLAAANHDQGWQTWEQSPQLNPNCLPTDFMEMPVATHLQIWRQSVASVQSQTLYGAVLVSQHARLLVEGRLAQQRDTEADISQMRAFCSEQRAWENTILGNLRLEKTFSEACRPQTLRTNLRLLQVFDWVSLLLCMNSPPEAVIHNIPCRLGTEQTTIQLLPTGEQTITVKPWPFAVEYFAVTVFVRVLPELYFKNDSAFQLAWHNTPEQPLVFVLHNSPYAA